MRLLVTGGAGFIGSAFVRKVLGDNFGLRVENVTVLDALTYAGNLRNLDSVSTDERFRFVHGTITDKHLVSSLVASADIVINFAAESHVDNSLHRAIDFIETNVVGVATILEAMRTNPGRRMIQVSTDEVYGPIQTGESHESDNLNPSSPYSASKASADLLCMSYFHTFGVDVVITRCSNNYGPFQFPEKVIPRFITNILMGKPIPIYGSGENIREWIHVDDHCMGIRLVLEGGRSGTIYNIGSDERRSNLNLAHALLDLLNHDNSLISYVADRPGHDIRYALDSRKIREELGFATTVDFSDGLRSTVEWYSRNLDWWQPLIQN